MSRHERLEQAAVVRNAQMQQLVRYDKVLKALRLIEQVNGQCDRPSAGARSPFPCHALNPDDPRIDFELDRPARDALFQRILFRKITRHD